MSKRFNIQSFNVNGLRAATKKGFLDWLESSSVDIACLQEIKVKEDQYDLSQLSDRGYHYQLFPAQKPGYSGTAILSKIKPINIQIGCNHELFDFEGRVLRFDYDNFSVISAYFPSGSSGDARQEIKMEFLGFFHDYINHLRKEIPKLVICGDYNICREAIDIHNPVANKKTSGFLPEEREWFARFLDDGFLDSFRVVNPELAHQYSWWSYRANARANNKGWRIDYNIITENLRSNIQEASISPDVIMSDHCPVGTILEF